MEKNLVVQEMLMDGGMIRFSLILSFLFSINVFATFYKSGFEEVYRGLDDYTIYRNADGSINCNSTVGYISYDDKLALLHCERAFPKNIISAFSVHYDIPMHYLDVDFNSLDDQYRRLSQESFADILNSVADWKLLLEFNYEAIEIWSNLKQFYQLDDNGVRSKIFELLVKRNPNELEQTHKAQLLEYKSRVYNFLNTATIPIYMDLPFEPSFHPFFNQIIIEKFVDTFPSRDLGNDRNEIWKFEDDSFLYDSYVLYSLNGLPETIVNAVQSHHKYFDSHEGRETEDPTLFGRLYPNQTLDNNTQWEMTRVLSNVYYLISIQDKVNCRNLGLWPMLARTYFSRFIDMYIMFNLYTGKYDLNKYLKDEIEEYCGNRSYNSIYSEYFSAFAAGMYLYRSMADGKELSRSRNAYGWWND